MKRFITILITVAGFTGTGIGNGVCIQDATEAIYFKLLSSDVEVLVNNQVAMLTTSQVFLNDLNADLTIKYAFPLYEDASATSLRWYVNGAWHTAVFSPSPQDTTLPGGNMPDPDLIEYLGATPLYFNVPDTVLQDSLITFELTYVQLLPYDFNIVDFNCPNDYTLIQDDILDFQKLHLVLESDRTIDNINLLSHPGATITNTGNFAEVTYEAYESVASTDYHLNYQLNAEELGLYSFSTFLPDSANACDDLGNGFLAFIVEPDPSDSLEIIQKVFTLIVDRSGSMMGDKMVQARNASSFIINHLNEGDLFNIVDFSSGVTSFAEDHVLFNAQTQADALSYISTFQANGSTNISGAFSAAIEDFSGNDPEVANIIIFFTDGQATAGLTGTGEILDHIEYQLDYWEVSSLMIHTFGIGSDVNMQLLSLIASQNSGLSEFLLDSELEDMITTFYLRIRNPVLLNTEMTFDPPLIAETYPSPLTNLYLGQQLIVVGRYDESDSITATFEGEALGQPQTYTYGFNLADSIVEGNSFLTKIWAKKKIDHLYVLYFTYPPTSAAAEEIKEEIIETSICYNVLSPFTSLTGGGGLTGLEFDDVAFTSSDDPTTYNYPNPFHMQTEIYFLVSDPFFGRAEIRIFDLSGRLIKILIVDVSGPAKYSAAWNGSNASGHAMPNGHYFYQVTYENHSHKGHMVKY
jgi:Ca-activated chloride channel family protein